MTRAVTKAVTKNGVSTPFFYARSIKKFISCHLLYSIVLIALIALA